MILEVRLSFSLCPSSFYVWITAPHHSPQHQICDSDWCLSDTVPKGSVCGVGNGPQHFDELKTELKEYVHAPKKNVSLLTPLPKT